MPWDFKAARKPSGLRLFCCAMPVSSSWISSSVAMMVIFWSFWTRLSSWICSRSSTSERRASCWNSGRVSWVGCTPEVAISRRIRWARS